MLHVCIAWPAVASQGMQHDACLWTRVFWPCLGLLLLSFCCCFCIFGVFGFVFVLFLVGFFFFFRGEGQSLRLVAFSQFSFLVKFVCVRMCVCVCVCVCARACVHACVCVFCSPWPCVSCTVTGGEATSNQLPFPLELSCWLFVFGFCFWGFLWVFFWGGYGFFFVVFALQVDCVLCL